MNDMPIEIINGVPLDEIPVHAPDTGLPLRLLASRTGRALPEDPIGGVYGKTPVVYPDWRLRRLQSEFGVETWPEPTELVVFPIEAAP